jgi:hypothetical protein
MAELLTGLIVCGACHAPLASAAGGHVNQPRYVCAVGEQPDCALVCCPVEQLDDLIMRLAQQRLEDAGLILYGHQPWRTATTDERRELITGLVTCVILRPCQAVASGQLDPAAVLITWGV